MTRSRCLLLFTGLLIGLFSSLDVMAQDSEDEEVRNPLMRGSLIEDRAARKLIDAGDARYEANEVEKALEIWKSVIERYPRSKTRYIAHMKLGVHFLDIDRAFDQARVHFETIATEENSDDAQRAEATLKSGVCYFHSRKFGKCFLIMRQVIEEFPVSSQVNEAYYYIGLAHFEQGHYSRAIQALERVGTTLDADDTSADKLEASKRFFIKIEDADLAVLDTDESVTVLVKSSGGDEEKVACRPIGRNVRVVLGSVMTGLGTPKPGNGILEVKGTDKVSVVYIDAHTAEKQLDQEVLQEVQVVANGIVQVTDGAFRETVNGVVLGKSINVQVLDPDRDITPEADAVQAELAVFRRKTDEEIEAERAKLIAEGEVETTDTENNGEEIPLLEEEIEVEQFKKVDSVAITLSEVKREIQPELEIGEALVPATTDGEEANAEDVDTDPSDGKASDDKADEGDPADGENEAPAVPEQEPVAVDDGSIHSGVFRGNVVLARAEEIVAGDGVLQALPGDEIRIVYQDESNTSDTAVQRRFSAKCLEGNIGGVRVTRTEITDQELRVQTRLKTADALTKIGNRYKEFGLDEKAKQKYDQALATCESVMPDVRRLRGRLLEETYVQLWHVYFEMDRLNLAAAMCERLQREFPASGFVDDALLQLGDVARAEGDINRAIGIYTRLANMQTSQLRGEAQFGIAECYEAMASDATEASAVQLRDRAFQEYKKVYDQFPDSGRVGEAVAKMANHYYDQQDYARAIDTFETVLENQPDAKYLDVILFNYGRCLYRLNRRAEARQRFEQLIGDFPESNLATDAKQIAEALSRQGS
ncbi:MAG: tetratricopeptide repeat protein [Pirellulales bacterium]|nr:tetratricopeptide repeat protein [Pirellulales bacterium]